MMKDEEAAPKKSKAEIMRAHGYKKALVVSRATHRSIPLRASWK